MKHTWLLFGLLSLAISQPAFADPDFTRVNGRPLPLKPNATFTATTDPAVTATCIADVQQRFDHLMTMAVEKVEDGYYLYQGHSHESVTVVPATGHPGSVVRTYGWLSGFNIFKSSEKSCGLTKG